MGRKRSSNSEDSPQSPLSYISESFSISSGIDSPPSKKLRKKYKKSHKHKSSELDILEDESLYGEKRKHRHKHKKHKKEIHKHKTDHCEDKDSESYRHHKRKRSHHSSSHGIKNKHREYVDDGERRERHSTHRKRGRFGEDYESSSRSHSKEISIKQEMDRETWDDDINDSRLFRNIKTEPVSDEEPLVDVSTDLHVKKKKEETKEENLKTEVMEKEESKEENGSETKEKINFGLSGKLTEEANTYNGIVIKYSQPPEARKPKRRWRWYIFKGDEDLPFLPLHRQSAYLIGRERKVADIPTDHPSCSKQHAVFQYRLVSYERPDGTTGRTVKPYILDLDSANGTYVNNRRIDPRRYVELMEKDVVKFGYSSREYVLLHEASKGSDDEMNDAGVDSAELSPVSLLRNM